MFCCRNGQNRCFVAITNQCFVAITVKTDVLSYCGATKVFDITHSELSERVGCLSSCATTNYHNKTLHIQMKESAV
jgi:hypothetical protein